MWELPSIAIKKLYFACFASILLVAFFTFGYPEYYILALPVLLLTVALFFASVEQVFYLVAFCTPISIKYMIGGSGINLPNEPLMLVFLLLFLVKLLKDFNDVRWIFKHPITILILINLAWLLVTAITSTLPVFSFKFLLARVWTVVFAFFWGAIIFKDIKNIKSFFIAFGLGLCLVIVYSTLNHQASGFSQTKSMLVMRPIMDDHTVYSAVCAIVLIFATVLISFKNNRLSFTSKSVLLLFMAMCSLGIVLSYSRAALLSLIFVIGFRLLLAFRIKFRTILISFFTGLLLVFTFSAQIYQNVKFNNAVSGKGIATDIRSISNVKTDESNVERINRWESGYRMFLERPFFGYGPGTYMFTYSAYQKAHEMTSISTTHGDMGGMHSEYFGPLVESGVVGLLTVLALFFTFIAVLMKIYYSPATLEIRMLSLAILLAMLSYFFHGVLNNFLDQDKIAVIFWAMMGMTVTLDYCNKRALAVN